MKSLRILPVVTLLLCLCCGVISAADGSAKIKDVSFDDVKFEMEKDSKFEREMITSEIENFKGKKLRIRGYIHPGSSYKRELSSFVLVRDNQECCFGPGAALYDCILIKMAKGKTAKYTVRPITVEGIFAIKEYKIDGKTWAIYRMKADTAK